MHTYHFTILVLYYLHRDYLGSITMVTDANGNKEAEYSYTAWGQLRNPTSWQSYNTGSEPSLLFGRGYTGHEHLHAFGLINMNARLYDASIGRFLSPDPYVQAPDFTQNFNRYSYALNNPLKFTDPDGEYIVGLLVGMAYGALIGAGASAVIYTAGTLVSDASWSWSGFGQAVGMGAIGGALGGALGFAGSQIGTFGQSLGYNVLSNVASNSATTLAYGGDITLGSMVGSVAGGFVGAGIGNFNGVKGGALKNIGAEMAFSTGKGAVTGAFGGGLGAAIDGNNIGSGMLQGAKYGAIAGGTMAGLNIMTMGAAYVPDKKYGNFGKQKPIYRRGTFVTKAFAEGGGMAVGRNLIVNKLNPNKSYRGRNGDIINPVEYNSFLEAHETAHYNQQINDGFANFYGKTLIEYLQCYLTGASPYSTSGTYEWYADKYAFNTIGYWYNSYGQKITNLHY